MYTTKLMEYFLLMTLIAPIRFAVLMAGAKRMIWMIRGAHDGWVGWI